MSEVEGKRRAEPRTREFTELGLKRLSPSKLTAETGKKQVQIWDSGTSGQRGLSVLVSAGGTKTFLCTFYLRGRTVTDKLGRVGTLSLQKARALTFEYRAKAAEGIDPRPLRIARGWQATPTQDAPEGSTGHSYGAVVAEFIDLYAKPRQRSWDDTQRVLTKNCAAWLNRDIASISKKEAQALLDAMVTSGHAGNAAATRAWLRKLWRWAVQRELVASPIMDTLSVEYHKAKPARVFDAQDIKAIWRAADKLDAEESAYVKLMLLLAPRRRELALMQRAHLVFDEHGTPTQWKTPVELTKVRKTAADKKPRPYLTPLPPLAQRLLKDLLANRSGERLFPSLPIYATRAGRPMFDSTPLVKRLVRFGAPADFHLHACRHTLATWLQNENHSEWERALVLNHAGAGSVTANYSHGYPLDLKRSLLTEWSDWVDEVVNVPDDNVVALMQPVSATP